MEQILKYFPNLSDNQQNQFLQLGDLYHDWNEKINVISRKDIDNLYTNHILHSLGITKFLSFKRDTKVLDFGTGGGFPGIPLAIFYPDVQFHLVDRIGKKLKVVKDIVDQLSLHNVTIQHGDIKEVKGNFDFVVSRAVMPFDDMVPLLRKLISKEMKNAMPNGIICLKGGDLTKELGKYKNVIIDDLSTYFSEPYFETKKVVYLPI